MDRHPLDDEPHVVSSAAFADDGGWSAEDYAPDAPIDSRTPAERVPLGPPPPPRGAWAGTYAELDALDLPEPAPIGGIGSIPVIEGEITLISGPSNVGKSLLAMRAAIEAALAGQRVLIVQGEGSRRSLRERVRRLARGLCEEGIGDAAENIAIVHGNFALGENLPWWRSVLESARPSIVVIDPLVAYFIGDENAAREMQAFLEHVALARQLGAAVFVVHHHGHDDKNGKSRERGSSALRGWVDEQIRVYRTTVRGEAIIEHAKSREHEMQKPQRLMWSFTDSAIWYDVVGADPGAVEAVTAERRATTLLGLLAQHGELTLSDARKRCGNLGGTRFQELIAPLEAAGKLHRADGEQRDALGRPREVIFLRLGPRPGCGVAA